MKTSGNGKSVPIAAAPNDTAPHHLGHRDRLRQRFLEGGEAALPDYELLGSCSSVRSRSATSSRSPSS